MRYPACEKLEIIQLVEHSHLPVRRTLVKLGNGRGTSREFAGDQGCARTALRLVQRRTEEARGRAKDRPHGRDVTGVGARPRAQDH